MMPGGGWRAILNPYPYRVQLILDARHSGEARSAAVRPSPETRTRCPCAIPHCS